MTTATVVSGPGVNLDWTDCSSTGLTYCKVARSSGPDPSYIRSTPGSVLIAAISPDKATAFVDHPGSGTWYYRVEAVGNNADGSHGLLGQTAVVSVTIP